MKKLIITLFPVKKNTSEIEIVSLLKENETVSLPLLRNRLEDIDLNNRLICCTDSKLAKVFKDDYTWNDHGIYYDLEKHPSFDLKEEIELRESKLEKLTGKRKETAQQKLDSLRETYQKQELDFHAIVVFVEKSTKKRDYERFLKFDDFVDPIEGYTITNNLEDYFSFLHDDVTFILDIETTGLDFTKDELLMVSVKAVGFSSLLIINNPTVEDIEQIFNALEGQKVIGHNLLFDLSWLMYFTNRKYAPNFYTIDTMLLAHVSGERRLSLKHLSMMYGEFKGRRNTMSADAPYLIEDMLTTELLWEKFKSHYDSFAGRLVCEATKVFSESKVRGVRIDSKILFQLRDDYKHLEESPYDFNINSNRELADYFIKRGVELYFKTPKGDYSVSQDVLERISEKYPIVEEYLNYKKELNIYQKYIHPYCELEEYHLRPDIRLAGTETGRLSCSNPNVQQIPNSSKFKDIFRSRFENGYIATIDLDRAELGIAALLSSDKEYVEALTSQDFHTLVASKTFEKQESEISKVERFTAKAVNFGGVLYGGSAKGIASRINVEPEIVSSIQKWYKKAFPVLTKWIDDKKKESVHYSKVVTFFGRSRSLDGLRRDQKERIGVNTSVQSVASDVMLYIVVKAGNLLRQQQLESQILFPVHDELLLDIHPEELEEVIEILKQAFKSILKTPLGQLELSKTLSISGTLEWADSWLYLKSGKLEPKGKIYISSLGDE